jgi:cytochrome c peroxidase
MSQQKALISMLMKRASVLSLFILIVFFSCRKDNAVVFKEPGPLLPAEPFSYANDAFPSYFNTPPLNFVSIPTSNPITDDGATLGRVLFYDKNLSFNNTISCASCHKQENAFSDPGRFSTGFNGGLTPRNSMALVNARFSSRFFWDQRAPSLEAQVLQPIQHPVEMGMTLTGLEDRLRALWYYPELFEKAFGSSEITSDKISKALAQFIRSMNSYRAKYDQGISDNFASFSQLELDGKNLFFSGQFNCNHCHMSENFTINQTLHNGLDSVYADEGRGAITNNPADIGKFKVPTLRNIARSAPYMHDGRFTTLEQVIEHYNSGIMPHPNLDDRLTTTMLPGGPPKQYNMTLYQKQALKAFLLTLTDEAFLSDIRFSDPFADN